MSSEYEIPSRPPTPDLTSIPKTPVTPKTTFMVKFQIERARQMTVGKLIPSYEVFRRKRAKGSSQEAQKYHNYVLEQWRNAENYRAFYKERYIPSPKNKNDKDQLQDVDQKIQKCY